MTAYALRTRRMILKDMGKAGLAVMVLGTAACASEAEEPDGTDPPATDPDTTQAGAAETTSTGSPDTTPPTTEGVATSHWQRVEIDFVSAYILARAGESVLVDTGIPNSEGLIESVLGEIGLGWDSLAHVVVTHLHNDHQGSLPAVLAAAPDAAWYAGAGDIDQIQAPRPGTVVGDGSSVFDLDIIDTPGHTLGHVVVLDRAASTLVAGDAIFGGQGGGVDPSPPQFTADMAMANASVAKLASFDYEVILFGHGDPILSGGTQAVADLAASL